jgi:hypothetical protein
VGGPREPTHVSAGPEPAQVELVPGMGPSWLPSPHLYPQSSHLSFPLYLPQPLGKLLPLLQGEPRVISVLFRAGRLLHSQLVCVQAARLGREPYPAASHLYSAPPQRMAHGPAFVHRLRSYPRPSHLPPCFVSAPPRPPSSLIAATHVQFHLPLLFLPSSQPGPGVHSCKTHRHSRTKPTVECFPASARGLWLQRALFSPPLLAPDMQNISSPPFPTPAGGPGWG